ncbi:hypothetical protein K0M31_013551 [Melipona bicolor]|uniref:Uncharacterized protein n=1 Tax=Melipona bicolor TaxID=60889 RepID=A0AA40FI79_9HYME|nr:hypothetical protein K0M31_013551 [Melipona bicolor]
MALTRRTPRALPFEAGRSLLKGPGVHWRVVIDRVVRFASRTIGRSESLRAHATTPGKEALQSSLRAKFRP